MVFKGVVGANNRREDQPLIYGNRLMPTNASQATGFVNLQFMTQMIIGFISFGYYLKYQCKTQDYIIAFSLPPTAPKRAFPLFFPW
jgi:hypothetical protein